MSHKINFNRPGRPPNPGVRPEPAFKRAPRHRVTIAQEVFLKEQSALHPLSSPGAPKRTYFFWETEKKIKITDTKGQHQRGTRPGVIRPGPRQGRVGGNDKETPSKVENYFLL